VFKLAWSKNGTPNTLGSAGDTITISDLTSTKFNVILSHSFQSGASRTQLGNRLGYTSIDSGNNYSNRLSNNGGADATNTSLDIMSTENTTIGDKFQIVYGVNIATEEKLIIAFTSIQNTAGAGNAPARSEAVGKWANTSNQFDQTQLVNYNPGSSDFDTNSNLTAIGTD